MLNMFQSSIGDPKYPMPMHRGKAMLEMIDDAKPLSKPYPRLWAPFEGMCHHPA